MHQRDLTHESVVERSRGETLVLDTSDGLITLTLTYSSNTRAVLHARFPINVTIAKRNRTPSKPTHDHERGRGYPNPDRPDVDEPA
jgi:hypothetical protein